MTLNLYKVEFILLVWLRLLTIFALAFPAAVQAQILLSPENLIQVVDNIQYFQIEEPSLELENIRLLPEASWQIWQGGGFNLGVKANLVWIRLSFQNISRFEDWVLSIRYPLLDEIIVHIIDEKGELQATYMSGDRLPFHQRVVRHQHFVFPMHLATGQSYEVYLKVKSDRSMQVPILISEKNSFYAYSQKGNLFIGFLVGLPLIMMMHNIFLFFRVRDRSQIDYLFYVAAFTLLTLALDGLGYQYLWPYWPAFQKLAVPIASSLVILAAIGFFIDFLQVKSFLPQAYRLLTLGMVLMGGTLAIGLISGKMLWLDISLMIGAAVLILVLYYLVCLVKRKVPSSIIFSISIIPALLGVSLIILNKIGLVGLSFWTENGAQLGVSLQICVLYFALTDRYRDERKVSYQMEQSLADRAREEEEARLVTESLTSLPKHIPFAEYLSWQNTAKSFNNVWQGIFPDKKNKRLVVFVGQVWAEENDMSATLFLGLIAGAFQMMSQDLESHPDLGVQDMISRIDGQVLGANAQLQKEMSFILAIIDFKSQIIHFTNAGHFPLVLISDHLIVKESEQSVWRQSAALTVESLSFKQGDEIIYVSGKSIEDLKRFFMNSHVMKEVKQQNFDSFQSSLYENLFPPPHRCEIQVLAMRLESESYL